MYRRRDIYSTLAEASAAAQKLGIKTYKQYKVDYRKDPLLMCWPDRSYSNEWKNWTEFLTGISQEKYATLEEASAAAKTLGLKSYKDYMNRNHLDPRLTSNPHMVYLKDWTDWYAFLGTKGSRKKYPSITKAKEVVKSLGFKSAKDYQSGYHVDPSLPSLPRVSYAKEWKGWHDFLGLPDLGKKYTTLEEASAAAQKLQFKTCTEYLAGYAQDPHLPHSPIRFYRGEWTNWQDFLDTPRISAKYSTLAEARFAAQKLGLKSMSQYSAGYRQDPRLRAAPYDYYDDWIDWFDFLGTVSRKGKYTSLETASIAARALGIRSSADYADNYKRDSRLPSSPQGHYPLQWVGWAEFLGTIRKKYLTLSEAKVGARQLGFQSYKDYKAGFRKDPLLPSVPNTHYAKEWVSWSEFLTGINTDEKYKTLAEARIAARQIGFKNSLDYKATYRKDPCLPSHPKTYYPDWVGWPDFLGKNIEPQKYTTLAEARTVVQNLEIKRITEYHERFGCDPRLPSNPNAFYAKEWVSWYDFLGINPPNKKYATLAEARIATQKLGFINMLEYQNGYKLDSHLPPNPRKLYASEWVSIIDFFLPKKYEKLSDVKHAIKVLKIKNSSDYREQYKLYPPLPAHPERTFSKEWIDWYQFCEIPLPVSYDEARSIVISENICRQSEYKKLVNSEKYPRLPSQPNTVYKNNWRNWHYFLGRDEPFKTKYIREPYLAWKQSIDEFLRAARGGSSKQSFLCQFLRFFVEKFQLGYSPQDFLIRDHTDIRPFKEILDNQSSDTNRRKLLTAVNEFLGYILQTYLTEEDDKTGELVTVSNARNPFATLNVAIEDFSRNAESNKPALAYQYVESLRSWIIPNGTKTFSDLTHLHKFEADWLDVDYEILDKNDPDCVWKVEGSKTKIWCPIYWLHTFALVSIPARGRQIAYNDSGEGDFWIPEFNSGVLTWRKNLGKFAGSTNEQGFIKRYANDQPGIHFTTNKTKYNGEGYDVPWIPLELAYWLIRLRDWQQKYNPLDQPTLWSLCKRTDLNEKQLIAKGANCFLFRDFRGVEPGGFSGRLSYRLAAALYYSQPSDLHLAELNGNSFSLSCFSSKYTPHSMRVSLITAYVMEFGLPIEVIMKIAGHSSIIMSLYYTKTSAEDLRYRFDEGEKRALKNKAYAAQRMVEQGRIDEIKNELIANNEQIIKFSGDLPAGTFLFRDYGICPFAGTRCGDGGDFIGKSVVRQSTPVGYLGSQNCLRCRHFISGPAFVGGLLSLSNEISLNARLQFEHYNELEQKALGLKRKIDEMEDMAYDAEKSSQEFDTSDINRLRIERRKTCSESESAAQKLDVLMCDIQAAARLIKQCKALINNNCETLDGETSMGLIIQSEHEIQLVVEESSHFRQLAEVCENAEIYESANADHAIAPRTQLLDKMALLNHINLHLFTLDKKQQLVVGNELTKLMISRLRTWDKVDALVEGKINLDDLAESERITRKDIKALIKHTPHFLGELT